MFFLSYICSEMEIDVKNKILQVSQLMFLKYGIKSVTMDDIVRELGMSKKTLYQYFENKDDLLNQIVDTTIAEDREKMQQIKAVATDAIDEIFRVAQHVATELSRLKSPTILFDMQKYHRSVWQKFDDFANGDVFHHIKANLERGIKEGLYRNDLDPDIIAKLYVSKSNCVLNEDMFPQTHYDKVRLFLQHLTYHIHGIATIKGIEMFDTRIKQLVIERQK